MPSNNRQGRKDMDLLNQLSAETGVNQQDILRFANGVLDLMLRDGATEYLAESPMVCAQITEAYVDKFVTEQRDLALRVHANPCDMESLCRSVLRNLKARAAA
jgi:hypothetical protein